MRMIKLECNIFHIDINHCYAQIEEMQRPQLRNVPMAVGGHEESRHGIILAKNDLAKKYGISTGESLREAKKKCADLLIIPPNYDAYQYYTEEVKNIYRRYASEVESFGLDEAWMDVGREHLLYKDSFSLAHHIQKEVLREVGLTVSVGVSYNKVFAKLGSDMKKPYGFTVITREDFQKKVWPLPVEELLYVGPETKRKLNARAIYTIGALARYPREYLKKILGVAGEVIQDFAWGKDTSKVMQSESFSQIKSVGNAITMAHDVHSLKEIEPVLIILSESIASRLKGAGMEGNTVVVTIRSATLEWQIRQKKIDACTNLSEDIFLYAKSLLENTWDFQVPARAVGITLTGLRGCKGGHQFSLFESSDDYEKKEKIDRTVDMIRKRFGYQSIQKASTLIDPVLCDFNPKEDHTIHPVGYFQGRKLSG